MPANVPSVESLPRTLHLEFEGGKPMFAYIDQRMLPARLVTRRTSDWTCVLDAVKSLAVRGAPAIGLAGASALALWLAAQPRFDDGSQLVPAFDDACERIVGVRPTAVNLAWALQRAAGVARPLLESGSSVDSALEALVGEVADMEEEDGRVNRAIGANGAALVERPSSFLTHCNAGSLATAFYGTALGIVYSAAAAGNVKRVYADETRPVGQGARLTSWELSHAGVPVTLICDNMAASLMAAGSVDIVVVGADRIAANGDVANKIGTYGLAVLAREHGIPFYVAAPTSTLDLSLDDGSRIVIEQRPATEVLSDPQEGVGVWNPAFDVTPARYITKIVTETGVFDPRSIARAVV